MRKSVLITGACGYLGRELLRAISASRAEFGTVVATDVRETAVADRLPGITYVHFDVRDRELDRILSEQSIDTVVHLAAIVTPGPSVTPELEYAVDVVGTRNVLEACVASGVRRIIVTSSGAAYGYHSDNPDRLRETDALRGNDEFPYARHKRLVEEMLAEYRRTHPSLAQLIFRPGAILGNHVSNQITALFEKRILLGIRGSSTPFVFIWDGDVVACLLKGIREGRAGIYNLAGDGCMTIDEIAQRTGKRTLHLPAGILRTALGVLRPLRLSRYGPEQVDFIRYRPVLANDELKRDFGYTPRLSTPEVFDRYWRSRATHPRSGPRIPGKVVMITGGASGIGLALAHRFGGGGARIALLDVDFAAAEQHATELREQNVEAVAIECDVTSTQACEEAAAVVVRRLGGIDVLINNAGITHLSRFAATDAGVLRRVMDTNFFGATNCTKAALGALRTSRGSVVVISSVAGFAPLVGRAGYAASKHALHGFFGSLRSEMRDDGVHVLLVCPGFTSTNIGRHALGGDGDHASAKRTTTGREASPEQVAEAIYKATVHRRRQIVLSTTAKLSYVISRCAPALYDRLMERALA